MVWISVAVLLDVNKLQTWLTVQTIDESEQNEEGYPSIYFLPLNCGQFAEATSPGGKLFFLNPNNPLDLLIRCSQFREDI